MAARPGGAQSGAPAGKRHCVTRGDLCLPRDSDVRFQFLQPRDTGPVSDIPAKESAAVAKDGEPDCDRL